MPEWLSLLLTAVIAALSGAGGVLLSQVLRKRDQRRLKEHFTLPVEIYKPDPEVAKHRQEVVSGGEAEREEIEAAVVNSDPEGEMVDLLKQRRS